MKPVSKSFGKLFSLCVGGGYFVLLGCVEHWKLSKPFIYKVYEYLRNLEEQRAHFLYFRESVSQGIETSSGLSKENNERPQSQGPLKFPQPRAKPEMLSWLNDVPKATGLRPWC